MSILEPFGRELIAHLQPHFQDYSIEFREPLDTEVQPRTIWLSADEIRVSERYANMGRTLTLAARLYVGVFYEVSKTAAHYMSVLKKRELTAQVLGGMSARAGHFYSSVNLIANVEDETTLLTEGYFLSSTPINIEWEVVTK